MNRKSETLEVPVLIAGAGPVGLGLALALSRCGVRSLVVEKKAALAPHSRALGVLPRTLEIFRAWNVLDNFLESGTFLTRPQIWVVGRPEPVATLDLSLLKNFTGTPGLLVLAQDHTERLLLDNLLSTGDSDVRFGNELLDFSDDESGVTARVKDEEGQEYSVRARFLIGCDGAHSKVRERLGWQLKGKTYPTRILLADIELRDARDELPWPRTALLPRGVLVALRYAPHRWRIIHSLFKEQGDETALSESYIASLVKKLFGNGEKDGDEKVAIIWSSVSRIHCRHSPRWVQNHVVLCGDAAHLNSPAGGQGMNSGLQDAHNLSWKLAAILNEKSAARADGRVLLSSYETERKSEVQTGVERYTDLLTRVVFLAAPSRRNAILAVAGMALRGFGFLRRRLALRAAMLDSHYKRSPILRGESTLVGKRAPDGVLEKGGAKKRLHDFLFPHAVLILFDDGRLPRWDESEIQAAIAKISAVPIQILRVGDSNLKSEAIWRDASGKLWRDWNIKSATATLVRPDGHIGWLCERPSFAALQSGVALALGQNHQAK